jgi:hypothetical protein
MPQSLLIRDRRDFQFSESKFIRMSRIPCLALLLSFLWQVSYAQRVELTNPLAVDRPPEIVEIPLRQVLSELHLAASQAQSIVAKEATTGKRVPSQIYASSPGGEPDQLLLLVSLRAHEKALIALRKDANVPTLKKLVFGREAPERKDDFAWENDLVTYRIYGPALQATGEITSGIDVWSKRVPNFVIDSFYKRDQEGTATHNPLLSYHKDNGQGLDSYLVGPTRGCGGTAVFADGKLFVSKNYTTMRILADGPIRFAFEVSYAPWEANGATVVETKQIVLDAGTHLNKITSAYSFHGPETLNLVAGIAVHSGAATSFPIANKTAAAWDTPQDPTAGRIATGLIAAPNQQASAVEAAGHALLEFTRRSGQPFVYYAGSGWSKADMPTSAAWDDYLKLRLSMLENPLIVEWSAR